jgi:hypothetical protein
LVTNPTRGFASLAIMTAANPIIQSNVTFTLSHRTTRGGRNLIYRLAVIQQPEQARACGAGFKGT